MVYLTANNYFGISEYYALIRDFIEGIRSFFSGFHDVFYVLFPFFTDAQVDYFVTITYVLLGVLGYLFFRKVTI